MGKDAAYLAEIRPTWRKNWLESIYEFAAYDLQCRSWRGGAEFDSPYWSYSEWMCRYFDDYALSYGYEAVIADGLVTPQEAEAVREFHEAAEAYKPPRNDPHDHEAILADPKWQHVVAVARSASAKLSKLLNDPSERALLERGDG
jgi:hypothetical protein